MRAMIASAKLIPEAAFPRISAAGRIALGVAASALIHALLYVGIRLQAAPNALPQLPLKVTLAGTAPHESIAHAVPTERPATAAAVKTRSNEPSPPASVTPVAPKAERSKPMQKPESDSLPQGRDASPAREGEQRAVANSPPPGDGDQFSSPAMQADEGASPVNPIFPEYPTRAAARNIAGKVELLLTIDEKGDIRDVSVVSVDPAGWGFEEATLAAFQGQKFTPVIKNGRAVKSQFSLTVTFQLKDAAKWH